MTWIGWERFFRTLGVMAPVIGITPKLNTDRGVEIASWLLTAAGRNEDIRGFVVIDDDFDPGLDFVKDRWVCVPHEEGLRNYHGKRIIEVLEVPYRFPLDVHEKEWFYRDTPVV